MYYLSEEQIGDEFKACPFCLEKIDASQEFCCGYNSEYFVTGFKVDSRYDLNGNYIYEDWLTDEEFTICEPNELTIQEKLDILGDMQLDAEKDK